MSDQIIRQLKTQTENLLSAINRVSAADDGKIGWANIDQRLRGLEDSLIPEIRQEIEDQSAATVFMLALLAISFAYIVYPLLKTLLANQIKLHVTQITQEMQTNLKSHISQEIQQLHLPVSTASLEGVSVSKA